MVISERGYLVRTLASRPGVPGSNPIAAPKPCEVYPSTSGLLTFKKSETVLWSIAKHYYHYYYWLEICHFSLVLISNACKLRLQLHIESVVQMVGDVSLNHLKLAFTMRKSLLN